MPSSGPQGGRWQADGWHFDPSAPAELPVLGEAAPYLSASHDAACFGKRGILVTAICLLQICLPHLVICQPHQKLILVRSDAIHQHANVLLGTPCYLSATPWQKLILWHPILMASGLPCLPRSSTSDGSARGLQQPRQQGCAGDSGVGCLGASVT